MSRLNIETPPISKTVTTSVLLACFFSSLNIVTVHAETSGTKSGKQTMSNSAPAAEPQEYKPSGWRFRVGAGGLFAPAFLGSKEYQVSAFPNVSVEFKNLFFASMKGGVGYNLIHSDGWRIGPLVKYEFGRQEDGSSPFRVGGSRSTALKGLGNVDGTLELGGFAEYTYEPLTYKAELRQGAGGHKGMIGAASINYSGSIKRLGPPIFYAFGPRMTFADSEYINAYFGINQTQSLNSGLKRYEPSGGFVSYGIGGFTSTPVYSGVSVSLFGGYDRLGGEVAHSPLVKERGSGNQFAIGFGITYKFDL